MGIELNNLYLRDEAQKWVPFKDWDISKIINENASAENEITVGEFFNNASPINNYLPLSGGTLTGDLHLLENSVIKGETPTSSYYGSELQFTDSNDNQIGYVGVLQSTDGEEGLNIGTSRTINGSSKYNSINLKILPNGTKAISFDDEDTKIAWQNALSIPTAASTVKPIATAAVTGTSTAYAREDHVHNIAKATITAALGFTPFNSASTLGITHGGTGLTAAPSMLVNLASTATASVFTASPRPGITGTLGTAHGGTSVTAAGVNKVFAGPATGTAAKAPSFRSLDQADIPNLSASKITAGTFNAARIPGLDASKITTGVLSIDRIPDLVTVIYNAKDTEVGKQTINYSDGLSQYNHIKIYYCANWDNTSASADRGTVDCVKNNNQTWTSTITSHNCGTVGHWTHHGGDTYDGQISICYFTILNTRIAGNRTYINIKESTNSQEVGIDEKVWIYRVEAW